MEKKDEQILIKEDALRIKENDILDLARSIENEVKKSYQALIFAGVILGFVFDKIDLLNKWHFLFLISLILATLLALLNIWAQKIDYHTKIDRVFMHPLTAKWEDYLNTKYLSMSSIYKDASALLLIKVTYNRWIIVLLIIAFFSLIIFI